MGIFQYKGLNFGINTATELFQKAIENVLSGLEGVKNISDDIIVHGKDQAEHDKRLEATLKILEDHGLTLNKKNAYSRPIKSISSGFTSQKKASQSSKTIYKLCYMQTSLKT